MDIKTAITGVREFFENDGGYFAIHDVVEAPKVRGQRVDDECQPTFDHCYVDQGGGGITGDDFHGTVYFHIGQGLYLTASY